MKTNPKMRKAKQYFMYFLQLILYVSILLLIRGESPLGKTGGYILIIIVILWNLHTLYQSREYLKQMKQTIFYIAKEKAKEKKNNEVKK